MNWNDYEMVWKRQKLPLGDAADLGELKTTFESKRRKLYTALMVRDYSEAGGGLLVLPAFVFAWWQIGASGWPIGMALLLIFGVCMVFIRERLRIRRVRLGEDAPLLARVEAYLSELQHQRRLLLSMWKWYLGPIAGAIIIIGFTISHSRPPWDVAHDPVFQTGLWGFNAGCLWFAWVINRRAVRKQIEPRIEELEKLRRDLTGAAD